jgi:hypothetical protein
MLCFLFCTEGVRRYPVRISVTLRKKIHQLDLVQHCSPQNAAPSAKHLITSPPKRYFLSSACNNPRASQTGVLVYNAVFVILSRWW